MKNILFAFAFLFSVVLFSQNQSEIKGTIIDKEMNEPMLLANIQLKGSDISYQTNLYGNFKISDLDAGEHTIIISYAGYETEELTVIVAESAFVQLEKELAPMQFSFDNVEGMDTAFLEEAKENLVAERLKK